MILLVEALAAYRLTRLATEDTITQPLREAWIEWTYRRANRRGEAVACLAEARVSEDDPSRWQQAVEADLRPPKLAELVTCRWCAGMWVSLGVVFVARRFPWWPRTAQALALSAASALVAGLERD